MSDKDRLHSLLPAPIPLFPPAQSLFSLPFQIFFYEFHFQVL